MVTIVLIDDDEPLWCNVHDMPCIREIMHIKT